MEPLILIAVGVLALLALLALVGGRNRRDASLEPTRLGPSWSPPPGADTDAPDPEHQQRRISHVAAATGTAEPTVAAILEIWDEYLGVLGLTPLPAGHRRRVYDPYDPPVARRGADGRPEPDRERVARDVASRLGIDETVTHAVLRGDAGATSDE